MYIPGCLILFSAYFVLILIIDVICIIGLKPHELGNIKVILISGDNNRYNKVDGRHNHSYMSNSRRAVRINAVNNYQVRMAHAKPDKDCSYCCKADSGL